MAHDVLISYSSLDKPQADAICNRLESQGIRCWIAPRDVPAGSEYADAIVQAIEAAQVLVLIYSSHADNSKQVRREVERAVHNGITIMPVRIENAEMSPAFEYYVGSIHWLDAITPPLEQHIDKLVTSLRAVLERRGGGAPAGTKPPMPPMPSVQPGPSAQPTQPVPPAQPAASRRNLVYGGVVVGVAALATLGLRHVGSGNAPPARTAAPQAAPAPAPAAVASELVPAVGEKSRREAQALLEGAGFKVTVVEEAHADLRYPKVIRTDPAAGQPAAGKAVTLVISGMKTLPSVADMPLDKATAKLRDEGFENTQTQEVPGPKPSGTVVATVPAGGSFHMRSKAVVMQVIGAKPALPDVVKQTAAKAEETLKAAGFAVKQEANWVPGEKPGNVTAMQPAAGTPTSPGDTVTLTVAAPGGWVWAPKAKALKAGATFRMDSAGSLRPDPQSNIALGVLGDGKSARIIESRGDGWVKVLALE